MIASERDGRWTADRSYSAFGALDNERGRRLACQFLPGHLYGKAPHSEHVLVDDDHRPGREVLGDLVEAGQDDYGLLCGSTADQPADEDY